jgi:TIR domain
MSDIFISYAHKDGSEVGEWLYTSLIGAGYNVFKDNHSMKPGDNFPLEIFKAIDENHYFIILISEAAINSGFVQDEIGTAKALKKKIIPIMIDDSQFPSYIAATQALILKKGTQDWKVLHDLVNALPGGKDIPRVINMCGHKDIGVKGLLVLKHFDFYRFEQDKPEEIPHIAQNLGAEAASFINSIEEAKVGIVPHGHPSIATAVQAYLLGAVNAMTDLYYTLRPPNNKFKIDANNFVPLQSIRESGYKDRSENKL